MTENHGTSTAYRNGCRCEECRAGNTARHKRLREKRYLAAASGKIPADVEHGIGAYCNWGCRCPTCVAAAVRRNRELSKRVQAGKVVHRNGAPGIAGCPCGECAPLFIARQMAARKRVNEASRAGAKRHGYQWTGPEMELAARSDLTAQQAAAVLGRTVVAVNRMRARLGSEPKLMRVVDLPVPEERGSGLPAAG